MLRILQLTCFSKSLRIECLEPGYMVRARPSACGDLTLFRTSVDLFIAACSGVAHA